MPAGRFTSQSGRKVAGNGDPDFPSLLEVGGKLTKKNGRLQLGGLFRAFIFRQVDG